MELDVALLAAGAAVLALGLFSDTLKRPWLALSLLAVEVLLPNGGVRAYCFSARPEPDTPWSRSSGAGPCMTPLGAPDARCRERRGDEMAATQTYRGKGDWTTGFPRDRTAVLVIDPVNDFLSEGGAAWDLTRGTVKKNDVVAKLRRVIDGAHDRNLPVLFAPMAYTEEDYAAEELQRRTGINRIMFERRMFLAGSWGADFHPDLQPADGDVILEPHKGTDVMETDLPDHLERLEATHVVVCGMTANLCCESTGRHLAEHGFDVTYLSDAIGAENLPAYEAAIHVNYPLIGNAVMEVDEFLAAIDAVAAPRPGDTVYGSDRGKVGEVAEVHLPGTETSGHLLVKQGLILDRDVYIPLDAVGRRSGDDVFINIPKLVVGKMPWDEPPTPERARDNLGPPARAVGRLYRTHAPTGTL